MRSRVTRPRFADATLLSMQRKYYDGRDLPNCQKTIGRYSSHTQPGVAGICRMQQDTSHYIPASGRAAESTSSTPPWSCPTMFIQFCLALTDDQGPISIPEITRTITSESARRINDALARSRRVWQHGSFDHVLRGDESLRKPEEEGSAYFLRIRSARHWLTLRRSIGGLGGIANSLPQPPEPLAGESPATTQDHTLCYSAQVFSIPYP